MNAMLSLAMAVADGMEWVYHIELWMDWILVMLSNITKKPASMEAGWMMPSVSLVWQYFWQDDLGVYIRNNGWIIFSEFDL